jgi:hypothetical protein
LQFLNYVHASQQVCFGFFDILDFLQLGVKNVDLTLQILVSRLMVCDMVANMKSGGEDNQGGNNADPDSMSHEPCGKFLASFLAPGK